MAGYPAGLRSIEGICGNLSSSGRVQSFEAIACSLDAEEGEFDGVGVAPPHMAWLDMQQVCLCVKSFEGI